MVVTMWTDPWIAAGNAAGVLAVMLIVVTLEAVMNWARAAVDESSGDDSE